MTGREPDELPGDWRRVTYIKETRDESGIGVLPSWFEESRIRVESARFNVVLEGSWPWIMRKITSYMTSNYQG